MLQNSAGGGGAHSKRLNVFQPKGSFGIGASELRYEADHLMANSVLGGGMMKDPSIKFQKAIGSPEYQAFTPNKLMN